jgi:hypothetical protein
MEELSLLFFQRGKRQTLFRQRFVAGRCGVLPLAVQSLGRSGSAAGLERLQLGERGSNP